MLRAPARTFVCEHCGRLLRPEDVSWIDLDPLVEPRMLFALCSDTAEFAVCFVPSRRVQ